MRVIDLLNKIANGEEMPKKIKYKGVIREYDVKDRDYITRETSQDFYLFYNILRSGTGDEFVKELNNEVEIIEDRCECKDKEVEKLFEEDKEIEEIDLKWFKQVDMFEPKSVELAIEMMAKQLNKTIKSVNELKKEGK